MIHIHRIEIRNYRGIKALEAPVGPGGAIAKGRNSAGKTTVLRAIGAALAAADIGPDAIRIGEENGEILITLDADGRALHVRRAFSPSGSSLSVKTADGDTKRAPATLLAELLGSAPLDVISMVFEKDKKKRRALILQALPMAVTVEQLRRWVPALPDIYDVSGHGLEVIERLRASAYEKRTGANKIAKESERVARELEQEARARRAETPVTTITTGAAREQVALCERALSDRLARQEAGARAEERMASLRARVVRLQAEAGEAREQAARRPAEEKITSARARLQEANKLVAELEGKLAYAREAASNVELELELMARNLDESKAAAERATKLDEEAAQLDATIRGAVETVSPGEVEDARRAVEEARALASAAERNDQVSALERRAEEAAASARATKAEAERLDKVVQGLTVDAPQALLEESPGAPRGLVLDGDRVLLDGVELDKLCGAEQMAFAAQIAKACNPGVGFLVVDGLERLDPDQFEAFVASATDGGWQLFGSLVDRGELVLAAIESRPDAEAAE